MKSLLPSRFIRVFSLATFSLLASCAVGPNYKRPAVPDAPDYYSKSPLRNPQGTAGIKGGSSQQFVQGLDIPAQWWELFHSRELNDLVQESLRANPNLKAAREALSAARENVYAQYGAYLPGITGGVAASHQVTSQSLSPVPNQNIFNFNLITPQVSVAFTPDVFGLNRRTVESLHAQEEQQRHVVEATYITLSSNVMEAAIQEASLRGQVEATQELITLNQKMVDLLRKQVAAGYASQMDLAAQEAQLAQTVATLPPLAKLLAQQRDQLCVLLGRLPGQEPEATFHLSQLELPRELPVSLPSRLIEQRPDIRQAEENLHAACAQVGIAVANRLPNFLLSGNLGTTATQMSSLFAPGNGFWTGAGALTQPIFEGGMLLHKERAARATYRQAAEQYRAAILAAAQNVADTLHALEQDAIALKAAQQAALAAKKTLDLTTRQVQLGYANTLALLGAEQAYQQARINLVQAQANRFSDTAALFLSLGGGWWNLPEFANPPSHTKLP
jgi:NodT family efflux transporter outer membrane factor (OMF) lipoprotein